jgi:plastocyanin
MAGAVRLRAAAGAAGLLLALAGCSDSGGGSGTGTSPPPPAAGAGRATVTVKDFAFSPASLTVAPGTVVTVVNQDSAPHTVTATGSKAFDTGTVTPGKRATFTAPSQAGRYPYMCTIHPFMKGTLTVS